MGGIAWSDEDKWFALKVGDKYERQYALAQVIEGFTRTLESLSHACRRGMAEKWTPPPGTKEPILQIEINPEKVKGQIAQMIASNPRQKTKMPHCLLDIESPEASEVGVVVTDLERKLQSTQDKLKASQAKLSQGYRDETLFQGLATTLKETVANYSSIPPSPAIIKAGDTTVVHGVALLGDEHGDAIVDSQSIWGLDHYDFNIFRCRLEVWARLVVDYINVHLPKHEFEHLWIFKLGDGIQGDINDGSKTGYFKSSLKGAIAVGEVEAQAILWIYQQTGIPISVISVSGNHPRRSIRKDYDGPQDNFDYLIATQIATRLDATPIQVFIPNAWTTFADVLGHIWAINHGDDVQGYAGFPWYGFDRKNSRVQALVARKGFRIDSFAYGHYHTAAKVPSAGAKSYHNGGWYFSDVYALNKLSVGDEPQQNLYIVSEKRGVIFEIPIQLKGSRIEKAYLEKGKEPAFGEETVLDQVLPPVTEELVIQRKRATTEEK
jgi:hypothetical protein